MSESTAASGPVWNAVASDTERLLGGDTTAGLQMRRETAGRLTHAAVNFLQVALTSLDPGSMFAAAPVDTPPADWPLDMVLWRPTFSDPAQMLVEAADLLQLAHELVTHETSFDDRAPSRGSVPDGES